MSIKSDLLKEIEAKAKKIRDKRVEASLNKTIEAAAFEFFKNIDESRKLHNNKRYDATLFIKAKTALDERLRGFDPKVKVSVEWQTHGEGINWADGLIRGITIWWSQAHITKNNVHSSLYIDVGQMLFI